MGIQYLLVSRNYDCVMTKASAGCEQELALGGDLRRR